MPIDDPREELEEIIDLYEEGKLPVDAGYWATGALEVAEGIFETIDDMKSWGKDAPTARQEDALENIYEAAMRWLE